MVTLLIALCVVGYFVMSDWYRNWGYLIFAPPGVGFFVMFGWHLWGFESFTLDYTVDMFGFGAICYSVLIAGVEGVRRMCRDVDEHQAKNRS